MSQENYQLFKLVLKYHIFVPLRTLLLFANYVCDDINKLKILEQSNIYNLYLGDTILSSNYVKVLALHPKGSECGFVEVCDSTHTRNLKKMILHL
ncbi:hypothetical protein QL285_033838 [Trifolium repens]|nr:hypothetical protein QL285_033838 [Trifolium repens]